MKKLLLIAGDLATGKSTFAQILSERYQTPVFFKDQFKEILGDTIGFSNREENLRLSVASAALMRMVFTRFCKLDKDLIMESNFRLEELNRLHEIGAEYGYEILTILLRADVQVLHKRFLHRLHNENRHAVHASGGFEEFPAFEAYVLGQRATAYPGQVIEICADTFAYQKDSDLLLRIDGFMEVNNE